MKNMELVACNKFIKATLNLPGSKSIANRVLPLAAFANGVSIIHNVPDVGEDVQLMLQALSQLGIKIEKIRTDANGCSSYEIYGCGGKLPVANAELFLGNSGTSIRFLSAMLALTSGNYVLTGIARMKERPIKDLVSALSQLGCQINYLENSGFPPIRVGGFIDSLVGQITISGKVSSQYLTGVLMALPLLGRIVQIKIEDELISRPYVDITLQLLELFGIKALEIEENTFQLPVNSGYQAIEYTVEPDASSASYFLAMGAINGDVTVNHLSATSLQGDRNFARVLEKMGAIVTYADNRIIARTVGKLQGITVDMEDMPDVAMTIAVLALFADGVTTINGIASWKVKETDRLFAIYTELTKLGAKVSYTDSSISIIPPEKINPNTGIDTYNDHRMAMCFSLLAVAGIPVIINDYECVGKTFANYFDVFKQIAY